MLGTTKNVDGQYYTVNPTTVNQEFDVASRASLQSFHAALLMLTVLAWCTQFTANRRDITILQSNIIPNKQTPVGIVAIGALLVGSVNWTHTSGSEVKKGDDIGWFQYGGSTVITLFPEESRVTWDPDLLAASEQSLETLVKVGEHIGFVSV